MAVGKNKTLKKEDRGSNFIFPITLRQFGRILIKEEGNGVGNFGEENPHFI